MAYREPDVPPDEPVDIEVACARLLHRRAERVRRSIVVPCVLLGLLIGGLLYVAVREAFLALLGFHYYYVTGFVAMLPPMVLSFRGARALGDLFVGRLMPGWTASLADQHGVDHEVLAEHALVALGAEPLAPMTEPDSRADLARDS